MVFLSIHQNTRRFLRFYRRRLIASPFFLLPSSPKTIKTSGGFKASVSAIPQNPEGFRGRRVSLTKPPEVFEVFGSEGGPKSESGPRGLHPKSESGPLGLHLGR